MGRAFLGRKTSVVRRCQLLEVVKEGVTATGLPALVTSSGRQHTLWLHRSVVAANVIDQAREEGVGVNVDPGSDDKGVTPREWRKCHRQSVSRHLLVICSQASGCAILC